MKHSHKKSRSKRLHKDWRTWVVVGLMLAAIGIYVVTLDDSLEPSMASQGEIPAAAAPAQPAN